MLGVYWDMNSVTHWEILLTFAAIGFRHRRLSLMHLFFNQTGIALHMGVHICLCVCVCVCYGADRGQEVQVKATKRTVKWGKMLLSRTESPLTSTAPL